MYRSVVCLQRLQQMWIEPHKINWTRPKVHKRKVIKGWATVETGQQRWFTEMYRMLCHWTLGKDNILHPPFYFQMKQQYMETIVAFLCLSANRFEKNSSNLCWKFLTAAENSSKHSSIVLVLYIVLLMSFFDTSYQCVHSSFPVSVSNLCHMLHTCLYLMSNFKCNFLHCSQQGCSVF